MSNYRKFDNTLLFTRLYTPLRKLHSYKDLPIRIGEIAHDFRFEASGAVKGIERVRHFCQNDAHLFVTPEQIKDEFKKVVDLIFDVYKDFNITNYRCVLSLRDPEDKEKYHPDDEMWNKAENELNAYRLKDETIRQASQRGISLGYIETIDFSRETAESINSKLDIFEKVSKADREKAISEYSKEPAPQTGERVTQKDISQMSYTELAEYLNKHPEVNL